MTDPPPGIDVAIVTEPKENKHIQTWKGKCKSKKVGPTFKSSFSQVGDGAKECLGDISSTMDLHL